MSKLCIRCNRELEESSRFCDRCGASQPLQVDSSIRNFLEAYEDNRWDEALQIYAEHKLAYSPEASRLVKLIQQNQKRPAMVFLDVEANPKTNKIWEIGAVYKRGTATLKKFRSFVASDSKIPPSRLSEEEKQYYTNAPTLEKARHALLEFINDTGYVAGHNINFDIEHIQEPKLSSKIIIDTLELSFLTWPTRFSYELPALTGNKEVHRALEDALSAAELFELILEHLQKMPSSRQQIILAANRDNRARKFLAKLLNTKLATPDQITTLILPTILEERKSMEKRLCPNMQKLHEDSLTKEIHRQVKQHQPCFLSVDGCISIEDQIRSGLIIGAKYTSLTYLISPKDLIFTRTIASILFNVSWPIPKVAVQSHHLTRLCPKRIEVESRKLLQRPKGWIRAFLAVSIWAMDSPECYIDEFSYWFRQDEESTDAVLLELSQHQNGCALDCGFERGTEPLLILADPFYAKTYKLPIVVPESHRLEDLLTESETIDFSSDTFEEQINSLTRNPNYIEHKTQLKKLQETLSEMTNMIVQFVRSRENSPAEELDRYSFRVLDFYTGSSDWKKIAHHASLLRESLMRIAQELPRSGQEPPTNTISKTATTISKLFSETNLGNVRWITIDKDEHNSYHWRLASAPISVKDQIRKLVSIGSITFVTNCTSKEKTLRLLLERLGLRIPVVQLSLQERQWPKVMLATYTPRPSRRNLPSFLTELGKLAIALTDAMNSAEILVRSGMVLNVLRRVLRSTAPNLSIISRTEYTSRRKAIAKAAESPTEDAARLIFLDQISLLRRRERKVNTKFVLVERVFIRQSDPVTAARIEAAGGGHHAYESFVLLQSALAFNEVISHAGCKSAYLVVCDTRLELLDEFLPDILVRCDDPSKLETSLSLPRGTLGLFDVDISTVDKALKEEGIDCMQELSKEDLLPYLKKSTNYDSFKEPQEGIIRQILGRQDTLVVMPTGFGKSICYQIPAQVFSKKEEGLTVIISPLQSLMRDQVQGLQSRGCTWATFINSSVNPTERKDRLYGISQGSYSLVYLAPEQLLNSRRTVNALKSREIDLLVIDEAHCMSLWGYDFRPDYTRLTDKFLNKLPRRPVVAAFTATATDEIVKDVTKELQIPTSPIHVSPRKENISLEKIDVKASGWEEAEARKKEALKEILLDLGPSKNGIVYCAYRKGTEEICAYIKEHAEELGRSADEIEFFHGGRFKECKEEVQDRFVGKTRERSRPLKLIVATNAFGLGIDKGDIHFVIHYDIPGSLEAYVQEVGRAGRDPTISAKGILIFSEFDLEKQSLLLKNNRVDERDIVCVYEYLKRQLPSLDGWIYLSEEDMAEALAKKRPGSFELDDTKTRIAIAQLERNGLIERGYDTCGTAVLRLSSNYQIYSPKEKGREYTLWQNLKNKLSETEWRTILLDELAEELGWDPKDVSDALLKLLREERSPIKEFEFVAIKETNAKEKINEFYEKQMHLLDGLDETFSHKFKTGMWISIDEKTEGLLLQSKELKKTELTHKDLVRLLEEASKLKLIDYREKTTTKDNTKHIQVKLRTSLEDAREELQRIRELDCRIIDRLSKTDKPDDLDTEFLKRLYPDLETYHSSLRRLEMFELIQVKRSPPYGRYVSLKLKKRGVFDERSIDVSTLKSIQRRKEDKLKKMAEYAKLPSSQERWRFIEEYFAVK